MNGTLRVTPEKLISAASEFNNCASVVKGLTSQMTSMVDSLNNVWSGDAATAYKGKFHQLDDDIARFIKMIQEHVKDLQEMARVYKQAEMEAKEASSSLPTDPIQ